MSPLREARPPGDRPAPWSRRAASWAGAVLLVCVATALCALGSAWLHLPDVVMVYLLAIIVAAVALGRGPAVAAAALSVGAYDFFFVPPYYTFAIAERSHLLTFVTMFVVGILISGLTHRLREQEREARASERRNAALYALTRHLAMASDPAETLGTVAVQAAEAFAAAAAVLVPAGGQGLRLGAQEGSLPRGPLEDEVALWVFESGRAAGLGTGNRPAARVSCHPLRGGMEVVGVLALAPRDGAPPRLDDAPFLEAFLRQAAISIERARLVEASKAATLRARAEEMRSSLLSAVSHDLRTPLAAITGAATTLQADGGRLSAAQRDDLLAAIAEESARMERLIRNLLDMTRIEAGAAPRRDWVPLEEILEAALARVEGGAGALPVRVALPEDLPLLFADPLLLEQVFVNLLDNAAKYTPPGSPIDVAASATPDAIVVELADRGPGIAPGDEARVFEKFHRGIHPGVAGVGLGLAICRGILEAHGGRIEAAPRPGGGAIFRIALPRPAAAPPPADGAAAVEPEGSA